MSDPTVPPPPPEPGQYPPPPPAPPGWQYPPPAPVPPGWQYPPPPGQYPQPPPGLFPGYSLPPYAPTPPKRRAGKRVALAVGAVAALAAASFGVLALTASDGGAASPEAAVEAFLAAAADEDILGILDTLAPGERDAFRPVLQELVAELERLDILSDEMSLEGLPGIDFEFDGVELASDELGDGVALVRATAGTVTGTLSPDDLPFGDRLEGLIDDLGGELPTEPESEEQPLDLELVAIDDGGWYVSLFYTAAEAARTDAGAPVPDFGNGIAPRGAGSPEEAVTELFQALADLDLEAMLALLPPDEAAVLHDYAPLFLEEAQLAIADLQAEGFEFSIDDLQLESAGVDGGQRVVISALAIEVFGPGFDVGMSYDGECFTAEGEIEGGDVEDFFGEVPGGEDGELCADELADELGVFGSNVVSGFVTVERGGDWYVSPVRTLADGMLGLLRVLDPDDIDADTLLEDLFGGALAEGFSEEEFTEIGAPIPDPPQPPTGLGDDPDLQPLAEACFEGDMVACDDLFLDSDAGSDYEEYGLSCGGRVFEGGLYCEELFGPFLDD